MSMLADVVEAVAGVDTHRDTHVVQMATSSGVTVASTTINNSESGFTSPRPGLDQRPHSG